MPEKAVKKAIRSAEIFVSPDLLREYREFLPFLYDGSSS
jgi:hypothetical protein